MEEEGVKFRDELVELPKREERTIFCECGGASIGVVTEEEDSRADCDLALVELGEALNAGLRDAVKETEAVEKI